jgi:hypothetical protein
MKPKRLLVLVVSIAVATALTIAAFGGGGSSKARAEANIVELEKVVGTLPAGERTCLSNRMEKELTRDELGSKFAELPKERQTLVFAIVDGCVSKTTRKQAFVKIISNQGIATDAKVIDCVSSAASEELTFGQLASGDPQVGTSLGKASVACVK